MIFISPGNAQRPFQSQRRNQCSNRPTTFQGRDKPCLPKAIAQVTLERTYMVSPMYLHILQGWDRQRY
jgi:hypothetical protein